MVTKESGMSRESHGEEEESPSGQKLLNEINKFHYVLSFSLVNHLYIPSSTHPPNHVEQSSIQRFVSHANSLYQKRRLKKIYTLQKKKKKSAV